MTTPEILKPAVQPSPLQSLIVESAPPRTVSSGPEDPGLHAVAKQIQHNLQYQHAWTDLRLHTHSPITNDLLPRPLISGLPSQRLYVHPDEQIELLKQADRARKANKQAGDEAPQGLEVKTEPEREWVLPTRLSEKWTLRRLAEVFNGITVVPPGAAGEDTAEDKVDKAANPWRTTKRVLLASADTDSTVVYYIVHDGVVKPRQN